MARERRSSSSFAQADQNRHPSAPVAGIVLESSGGRTTVVVTGRVDRARAIEVSGTVRGATAVGAGDLVVDLSHAWDGAVLLPMLARLRAELAERGVGLRLVGVALPEFLAALVAARLDEVFLVYDAVRGETGRRVAATTEGGRRAGGVRRPRGVGEVSA